MKLENEHTNRRYRQYCITDVKVRRQRGWTIGLILSFTT